MNCLKHKKEASKSYRDAQGLMLDTLILMSYAYALELHDTFGFGKERLDKLNAAVIETVHACIARYDKDYADTALRSKCKDFGFVCKIKPDEKGAVCWDG